MRTLVVTTPAASTALTTVEAVKTELGITDVSDDAYLESQIERASALICSYLGVIPADDGSVTLGRETVLETIYPARAERTLILSRRPVSEIATVTEDEGGLVDPADYLLSPNTGILNRLIDGDPTFWLSTWSSWVNRSVAVAYTAGWLLPDDAARNLPLEIEAATISMVKAARFNRSRDPALRSENILEGLYSYSLFGPTRAPSPIPPDIAITLNPFRTMVVR